MKIFFFIIVLLYSPLLWSLAAPKPPSFIEQNSNKPSADTVNANSIAPALSTQARMSPEAFSYQFDTNTDGSNEIKRNKNQSIQTVSRKNYISAAEIKRFSKGSGVFLRSHVATIYDERDQEFIFARNSKRVMSIASLTKLVMAMVTLDAKLPMRTVIKITKADKDRIRYSKSRLSFGSKFSRRDLLLIALLASENRAAAALARNYPGGKKGFVVAMNKKARSLGLRKTRFYDPAGLHDKNVSTARELNQLAQAAMGYPLIKKFTTMKRHAVINHRTGREMKFGNTNRLAKKDSWKMRLSKTGFTNTAGNCLIMKTTINQRPVTMVLLNSWGKLSKYGDSNRLKKWLIKTERKIRKKRLAEAFKAASKVASNTVNSD